MIATASLIAALTLYALGTISVLVAVIHRGTRLQSLAFGFMSIGFIAHTIWIGTVCVRTHHPPLTNLPEATAFISWTLLAIQILLFIRYRVHTIAFFVYPLVLSLMTVTGLVHEHYAVMDPSLRSTLFITHLLLSTLGVAGLLVALIFALLYYVQQRSLRLKREGALWDWIPSLQLCDVLTYRSLSIGFVVYTLGLLAGILWSYRTSAEMFSLRPKEIAAIVAWIFFAALLQSYLTGSFRTRKNLVISAAAFVAIMIAVLGIHHG